MSDHRDMIQALLGRRGRQIALHHQYQTDAGFHAIVDQLAALIPGVDRCHRGRVREVRARPPGPDRSVGADATADRHARDDRAAQALNMSEKVGELTGLPLSHFATAELVARARAAGFVNLFSYVEALEAVARRLADVGAIAYTGADWHECACCSASLPTRVEHHDKDCPYRMAVALAPSPEAAWYAEQRRARASTPPNPREPVVHHPPPGEPPD